MPRASASRAWDLVRDAESTPRALARDRVDDRIHVLLGAETDDDAVSAAAQSRSLARSSFARAKSARSSTETTPATRSPFRVRPELRERAAAGTILKGTIARSFPDPRRHGDFARARRLHRLHPRLRRPSQRALRRLARSYGLGRIAVFGSAVRADFGPESDVDVLVRYLPTAPRRIAATFALERELEGLFDRDVDVVDEGQLSGRFRPFVEAEEVTLLG